MHYAECIALHCNHSSDCLLETAALGTKRSIQRFYSRRRQPSSPAAYRGCPSSPDSSHRLPRSPDSSQGLSQLPAAYRGCPSSRLRTGAVPAAGCVQGLPQLLAAHRRCPSTRCRRLPSTSAEHASGGVRPAATRPRLLQFLPDSDRLRVEDGESLPRARRQPLPSLLILYARIGHWRPA